MPSLNLPQALASLCASLQQTWPRVARLQVYLYNSNDWVRLSWSADQAMQSQAINQPIQLEEGFSWLLRDSYFQIATNESIEPIRPSSMDGKNLCLELAHVERIWLRERLSMQEPLVEGLQTELNQRMHEATEFQQTLKILHEVTIELSKASCQDELYYQAVHRGLHQLGFDRLAILLIDPNSKEMLGTYGTDEQGQLRDEHYFRAEIPQVPFVQRALKRRDHVAVWEDTEIFDELKVIGTGWNAMVSMWQDDRVFGWIAVDNYIHRRPMSNNQQEILRLFGSALSQLSVRKKIEEAVKSLNEELEARVEERTNELSSTNRRLEKEIIDRRNTAQELLRAREIAEQANRTKGEFLANMSHEIRTPMNAIIGMTELALQTQLDHEQRNYLDNINDAARFLLGILNDVLDFSKVEAGKMELSNEPFSLPELLDRTLRLMMFRVDLSRLNILLTMPSTVPWFYVGDTLRLGQVLTNMLSNAIKFTEHGQIELSIEASNLSPYQPCRLDFSVRDTGIGLHENEIKKIFDVFSQADSSTTRRYGGTGLGLSISKKLIKLMGGDIAVDSTPGTGSCFRFHVFLEVDWPAEASDRFFEPLSFYLDDAQCPSRQRLCRDLVDIGFQRLVSPHDAELVISEQLSDLQQSSGQSVLLCDRLDSLLDAPQITDVDVILPRPWLAAFLLKRLRRAQRMQQSPNNQFALGEEVLANKRILLVEDNQVNQMVVLGYLKQTGISLDLASNGAEALAMLNKEHYDLVLMDCQMPVLDGYETTRRLRRQKKWQQVPVLAMTAHALSGDREKCLASGMNDYLTKPLDRDLLRATLVRWLS